MKRFGWGNILFGLGAVLLLVAAVLYLVPSDDYILLPENAKELEPLVQVQGEKPDRNGGGIYYVAVDVRKASLLEKAFPGIHEGSTLIPAHEFNPTGEDDRVRVLAWHREKWGASGPFGVPTMTLDRALDYIASNPFFWIHA